jgi:hypothetical protein
MILYSNSCSFGAPQDHKVYGNFVAEHFDAKFINSGVPGSCNRRIIRTSLRDLLSLKDIDQCYALIGLSFIGRTELWQPTKLPDATDGHFHPIKVNHHLLDWSNGLINTVVPNISDYAETEVRDYYKNWLIHFNPESVVTDLLTDLLMFTGWARNNQVRYVIFSNVDVLPSSDKIGYTSPFISSLVAELQQDKNVIDPWTFSFGTHALSQGFVPKDHNKYGVHGHPGYAAHQMFGQYLINHIEK